MQNRGLWYKNAIFYELNVRAFYDSDNDGHGDLLGLLQKLDYLRDLGVDCIWLQPFYPSPMKDDGYDISDYMSILPEYGTVEHLRQLLEAAHARDMRVIADLVMNHTSDQHPWFQAARSSRSSPYRDYYVWSDTDQKYKDARIIFLDTEPSNWSWDNQAGQYYWHRFYASQPDLNFDSPAVQEEIVQVMRYWLDLGLDGFRADAVPYLFEREGTNCENLPETHAYLKRLRRLIEQHYPGRILLCEANQWPEDVRPYFGDGDEFHMGFHFPLMPRIFLALHKEDITPVVKILEQTPTIPETCQWCTFLRNHDELTLEMVTEEERQQLWEAYAPEPRMRLNLGIRRRLAPLLDNHKGRIALANSLLFSLPGAPIIYYGDEIGMGDDIWLFDRNGVRTPMQWDSGLNAGFSKADPQRLYSPVISRADFDPLSVNVQSQLADPSSLFHIIRRMIAVRKSQPSLCEGEFTWAETTSRSVAAYWRTSANDRILVINNLSAHRQEISVACPQGNCLSPTELFTDKEINGVEPGLLRVELEPFKYMWIKCQ